MRLFFILVSCFLLFAQTMSVKAKVLEYHCKFPEDKNLNMIAKIDTTEGFAVLEGKSGLSKLEYHIGSEGFSLMEKIDSGTVQTTTILSNGSAVHSRNTIILGRFLPSQYKGECKTYENKGPK